MGGYLVFQRDAPVKLNSIQLGLFDLMREFEQDPFPFRRGSPGLCLCGLDELLFSLGILEERNEVKEWDLLLTVKKRLKASANNVSNMAVIHVPIARKLVLEAENRLYAMTSAGKRIPLWRIFGCNPTLDSVEGHATWSYGENLS